MLKYYRYDSEVLLSAVSCYWADGDDMDTGAAAHPGSGAPQPPHPRQEHHQAHLEVPPRLQSPRGGQDSR